MFRSAMLAHRAGARSGKVLGAFSSVVASSSGAAEAAAAPLAMQPKRWKSAVFEVPLDLDHGSEFAPGEFRVQTFNKISPVGLSRFPQENYAISGDNMADQQPHKRFRGL